MKPYSSPFLSILPSLDVHGYTRDTVRLVVSDFINDNIKLKNDKIVIIHGIGDKILSSEIREYFKKDKRVNNLYISSENPGCSILELKL